MFSLRKLLFYLYFVFGIFPSLSILTVDVGVPYSIRLFHVIGVVLGLLILMDHELRKRAIVFLKDNPAFVLLLVLSILVALLAGLCFKNMPIMSQRIGVDWQITQKTPLILGLSQCAHIAYLALGLLYILSASIVLESDSRVPLGRLYKCLGLIIIVFSTWQFLGTAFNVYYPNSILYSNERLGHIQSNSNGMIFGTFSEPSLLAGYLVGYIGILYSLCFFKLAKPLETALLATTTILTLFMTQSMTAFAGLLIIALISFLLLFIQKSDVRFRKLIVFLLAVMAALSVGCAVYFYYFPESVPALIRLKLAGGSTSVRAYADLYALSVLAQSHYFGVGLGVNATNSLLVYILSSLGVVGLGLFVYLFVKPFLVVMRREGKMCAIFAVLPAVLMVSIMAVSIPNLDYPPLWMSLAWVYFLARKDAKIC